MSSSVATSHLSGENGVPDFDSILGHVSDGVTVETVTGQVIYANAAAAQVYGFATTSELVEAGAAERLWPRTLLTESGSSVGFELRPAGRVLSGEPIADQIVRLRKSAARDDLWYSLCATPYRDASGQLQGAITFWHDVTTLKRSEATQRLLAEASAALAASLDIEATLSAVARMAVPALADWCVVFLVDDDRNIHRVELAAADPKREELLRQIQDQFPPVWESPLPAARVIRTGEVVLIPSVDAGWLKENTGHEGYEPLAIAIGLRSTLVVPMIAEGRILGALSFGAATAGHFGPSEVAVATELGSRAGYAVDHARLYASSREAIDSRDRFLSIAAHELRTPVAVMKAFAELLEREQVRGTLSPARTSHLISRIVSGANRLDHLTSEVLDVARSHLGQLPLRPRPFDLVDLVQEIADRHRERVVDTHQVVVEAVESAPLVADPERIEQVLINLIENALKYSPAGGTVRVIVEPDAEGVRVSVIDDGIGLPVGAVETIFSPFERATNAAERGIPGLGLGLYIGRSFVERHGGRIWAESAGEDQGTAVAFWLPATANAPS